MATESTEVTDKSDQHSKNKTKKIFRLKAFLKSKKWIALSVTLAVVLLLGVLFAVSQTRYLIAGKFIKKTVEISVVDEKSAKPISDVSVSLGEYSAKTNASGVAVIKSVPVGHYDLKIEKKYYDTVNTEHTVPIIFGSVDTNTTLAAIGKEVALTVTNMIDESAIAGATVNINGTKAVANEKGVAYIGLPIKPEPQKGTVEKDGYNTANIELTVDSDTSEATAKLAPAGKVLLLSKRTGVINVMSSNLDGSDQKTVVEGTGNETDTETSLLVSNDWKYAALYAKRDDSKLSLYLVDATNDNLAMIDEGDSWIDVVGWSGHRLVYTVTSSKPVWEAPVYKLKSYDVDSKKLSILDETMYGGYSSSYFKTQYFTSIYIRDGQAVYGKYWTSSSTYYELDNHKNAIMTAALDGSGKKALLETAYVANQYISSVATKPDSVYFMFNNSYDSGDVYKYENNKVEKTTDLNLDNFFNTAQTMYFASPSLNRTLWSESRDGKDFLFVGDNKGGNERVVSSADYTAFGWYTDKYILLSKNGSELYIMPADGATVESVTPIKISDYHKPLQGYYGRTYGYGGV